MLQHRSSEALFALHDQDGLLDLLPLRAQFRKHLADVHNSTTSVSRRYRCGEEERLPNGEVNGNATRLRLARAARIGLSAIAILYPGFQSHQIVATHFRADSVRIGVLDSG